MLRFDQVMLRRGPNVLVDDVSFIFSTKHKVGLTGANGCGKSSLLAAILGALEPDTGSIVLPADWVIAHVAQSSPDSDEAALDYVLQGDKEYVELKTKIETAEQSGDGAVLGQLHGEFDAIGGYAAQSRASSLLNGLGFSIDEMQQAVHAFSGGWRMRLNLAQALMCRSDLLLLDEPSNHLDLDAVIWLQTWLERYAGTLILISHDRIFLDAVVRHIAHIEQGKLKIYTGNYSAFEVQCAAQLAQQQSAHEKQQREVAHMQDFVRRFKAKATKAKQAQSRLKMLKRMEKIAPAHVDSPFNFSFKAPDKIPGSLLTLEKASVAYGNKTVFSEASLTILAGDRLGLIGPNGAGKSSLIKLLAGELMPSTGSLETAKDLRIAYFAQHQLDQLRSGNTSYQHLDELELGLNDQQIYDHLGGFGFSYERINEVITHFSGGEKARLALALLVAQKPNLLLLDEPTNHLDIDMRHALSVALQSYQGAMIIVSHDRFLLETVSNQFYLVSEGKVSEFEGDLEDYRKRLDVRRIEAKQLGGLKSAGQNEQVSEASKKDQRRLKAAIREQLKPLRNKVSKYEKSLERLSNENAEFDERLADANLYDEANKAKLNNLLVQKGEADKALAEIESAWMDAQEALDKAMDSAIAGISFE